MISPMLAFIVCGLLTQVTKAAWYQPIKCWKNDVGYCRIRCLDNERYIYLCKNKVSCCILRVLSGEKYPRPQPRPSVAFPELVTFPDNFVSVSPGTRLNDEVKFKETPAVTVKSTSATVKSTLAAVMSTPAAVMSTPAAVMSTPAAVKPTYSKTVAVMTTPNPTMKTSHSGPLTAKTTFPNSGTMQTTHSETLNHPF
ncbi:Defb26 [Phodopus roborovskii]|uniref:Beta-defensin n=1 Tax=Phodopus roborovskii TaxID=109678 RepID=A0AAU9YRW2_PHORO|nr:Defb26 [Phodopus roborovskii]